jgi:hypothetical protein
VDANYMYCCQSFTIFWSFVHIVYVCIFNTCVSIDFSKINKYILWWGVIIWILPIIDSIIVRKFWEKKETCIWLHHVHVHIIRLYTKLQNCQQKDYLSLFCCKSWSATLQNAEMLLTEGSSILNDYCFIILLSDINVHNRLFNCFGVFFTLLSRHDIRRFQIYH